MKLRLTVGGLIGFITGLFLWSLPDPTFDVLNFLVDFGKETTINNPVAANTFSIIGFCVSVISLFVLIIGLILLFIESFGGSGSR
ncbi:MAG: hypothetical protein FWB84_07440 [Candidatus Bathyarchaeota archaeon]|uniref:hypothetical protein n=1 Tax=Candidatus Bathycorpusculum sp. TaxID=2994959 RepID=UPI0028338A32|nr:hypothetical protein [Candidatus Termiticorpusculum sp.]MCL2258126.1 hypothetical protein [Candidatus Termiticorpusculum sp.]MCL2291595.1 hypothetical protein [Candidatus Termiticorpusculum sp.]